MSLPMSDAPPRRLWAWPIFVIVVVALGALSSTVGSAGRTVWYPAIPHAPLTPPGWVFITVWTILYAAMATAAWLVWRRHGVQGARRALTLFAAQLAFNLIWSPIFFGLQSTFLGFLFILPVLALAAATMVAFFGKAWRAGLLFVPYVAWVAFATMLAWQTWRLNA
jgi:benzodiazapine receptor